MVMYSIGEHLKINVAHSVGAHRSVRLSTQRLNTA